MQQHTSNCESFRLGIFANCAVSLGNFEECLTKNFHVFLEITHDSGIIIYSR